MADTILTGRNVMTPHPPEAYPDRLVVVPGGWKVSVICLQPGEWFVAHGGERVYGWETVDGHRAERLDLGPGDRATLDAAGLPHGFARWRVERAR